MLTEPCGVDCDTGAGQNRRWAFWSCALHRIRPVARAFAVCQYFCKDVSFSRQPFIFQRQGIDACGMKTQVNHVIGKLWVWSAGDFRTVQPRSVQCFTVARRAREARVQLVRHSGSLKRLSLLNARDLFSYYQTQFRLL